MSERHVAWRGLIAGSASLLVAGPRRQGEGRGTGRQSIGALS
ncbi:MULTISPECIES: hypothetical protein [unclassified Acidisoma]|nr:MULTISPECIES: hypothetical protein [unclassified Acidisoma]